MRIANSAVTNLAVVPPSVNPAAGATQQPARLVVTRHKSAPQPTQVFPEDWGWNHFLFYPQPWASADPKLVPGTDPKLLAMASLSY